MKTVLVITYYWPPAGGPGVQRVLKFCRYLPQFGWRPLILTVADGEYPALDDSLADNIAPDQVVYRTASLEPFSLYRRFIGKHKDEKITTFVLTEDSQGDLKRQLAAFIRGNFFIPDGRIGWKPFAVRRGLQIIRRHKPDVIFSTAPPMSTHLIAKTLAHKSDIPWVADFRDPWTDIFYYHNLKRTRCARLLDQRLEVSVLRSADAVVTVSSTIQKLFQKKVENTYFVIANGFDSDDFSGIMPLPDDGLRHIVHAGHLAVNQNPPAFWAALSRMTRDKVFNNVCIDFYGSIHSGVEQSLKVCGLIPKCRFFGYKPHHELASAMKRAGLLFFIVPDTSYAKGIPTSKLFDYLGASKPILGVGPTDGDAAEILRQTRAGMMVEASDEDGLLEAMVECFKGSCVSPLSSKISTFSRQNLTGDLAELFNRLI